MSQSNTPLSLKLEFVGELGEMAFVEALQYAGILHGRGVELPPDGSTITLTLNLKLAPRELKIAERKKAA